MRPIFCLLALLWGNPGYADTEFWISVASSRDMEHVEEFRVQASGRLQETLSIATADTPKGVFFRVVAGPYLSYDSAEYTLRRAQDAGYADAWIFAEEGYLTAYRGADFDDLDLPPIGELPAVQKLPTDPTARTPLEPVREAPEGYQLHKLLRKED
ncbi:MAG: SPOR domain-containing protein [Gammaproteobacteria bacterium]|nr:SPOR domain-containing protein [Gammaproteobacteria bacterium]